MKTNILSINTITKSLSIVMMLCVFGVGQIGARTTIASWGKVEIPTSSGPTASGGDANNSGTARITSSHALNNVGSSDYAYYSQSDGNRTITISNLTLTGYKNIKVSFYSRASQKGTLKLTYSSDGTNFYDVASEQSVTLTTTVTQYSLEGVPPSAVKLKFYHDKAKSNSTFYFGTVVISGDKISEGECTAEAAKGIAPGDEIIIYYSSATKEMGAVDGGFGSADSYSTTPVGSCVYTVEAGYSNGTISFKNGGKYIQMPSASAANLTMSTTKDNKSSWIVTFSGTTATIQNKANTSYYLRYNSSSPRFANYTSGTSNTHAVEIYRYCLSALHVTYDANTTDPSVANMPTDDEDYDDGDPVNISSTTPTRTGYTFDKWYTNAGCTTPVGGYSVGQTSAFNITESTTLYAHWNPVAYRVDVGSPSHVTIGVSSPTTIAEGAYANVNCGATVTLSESSLESGYTAEWKVYKTGDESTTVSVSGSGNGATFTMPAYPVTVTKTITAPWIYFTSCSSVLTVTYNANGGTGNVPVDANEYAKNDNVTVLGNVGTPSTLSKDGYTFGGWQVGGVGDVYEAGDSYTITSNTTFYAVWTPNNYKITSISTNPASSGTVTAEYNSAAVVANVTEIPCGSTVTLSQEPNRDKTFTSWTIKNASTSADVTATYLDGNTLTMPPFNCTVTANYSAKSSCVVTFSLQSGTISTTTIGGTDYTTEVTLYTGEGITAMPTVSSISCGDWGTVVGWTTNSSYSSSSTPPSYVTASVGTPYNPGSNTTLYAVYRKTDGSPAFDGTNSGTYYIRSTPFSTSYYASECMGSDALLTSGEIRGYTSDEDKVAYTFTKVTKDAADYYNITCDGTHYLTSNSGSLSTTETYNADAALWSVSEYAPSGAAGTGAWRFVNKSTTRNFVFTTNSRNRFVDWANGNFAVSGYPLELIAASTYYYSIDPECTSYTVTKGTCTPASSVLDASSAYCDFKLNDTENSSVIASGGGSVTIYLYPNDDYTDVGATVSVDVPGNCTIDAINTETHTCLIYGITGDITVSVTYVKRPHYTVHLYDQGVKQSDVTQTHYGANVTLPTGNNCGGGSTYTFVGWTDYANTLAGEPVKPNIVVAAASLSSWAPTAETTLYAVYSKSYETCDNFAAGVSGSYIISQTVSSTTSYVQPTNHASRYDKSSESGADATAEKFTIAYSALKGKYTIRTSTGYLGYDSGEGKLTKGNSVPYYWNIASSGGGWKITPPGVASKWLTVGTYFQIMGSDQTALNFTKATTTYYYSVAVCSDSHTITFHNVDGATINAPASTPVGSWSSPSLSGLSDCDKVTVWPIATYAGWAFVGWSTEDFSNSGNHTADYAEENGSTDEPYTDIVYGNGANSYTVLGGNVDMYPIFTRLDNNEPMDLGDGGEFYVYFYRDNAKYQDAYYSADSHFTKVYAKEGLSSAGFDYTLTCSNAQLFNFIPDAVTGKWDIKIGDEWLTNATNNDLALVNSKPSYQWTITKDGARYLISYDGNSYNTLSITRLLKAFENSNTWRFKCYGTDQDESSYYYTIYVGTCEERIFSSEPNPTPTIDLTGEPIVTSSVGQEVRATATMTLTAAHLTSVPATRVKITGTNLRFATTATATPAANCYVDLVSGNANATLYVYYQPTATEDGIENISVTAQAYNENSPKDLQTTGVVHARHLPADFVIAAKWDGKWYALPNTCAGEGSNTAGVQIEVDDADAPTAATAAPSTAKWGMRQAKAGSRSDGSYNDRLVFTERTTAEANNQKTLYNYNKAEVFTSATYTNYNNTNPERYEWIPVTTDFGDYELTSANDANHHLLLRNSDGLFVAQNSDKSYDGKVRLLPATFYEEAPVQIIEWKSNSVVVMYTGTETSATTQIAGYDATSAQTLASQKLTHGIYELTTNASMNKGSNSCKNLTLTFGSTKKVFEIPFIITSNISTFSGDYSKKDIIITRGCKLTASSTKYSYRNIYIYGGGKLDIPAGGKLGVNNIILRAGGISTNGSGGSATYEYVYPQIKLASTAELSSTKANIKYEYITDYSHWYHLCLPFDGTLNSITYPVEYYGDNVAADNHGSWQIKRYAGEIRATGNYNAWVDIESESATSVTAGHGYIYWGAPKKITIGEDKQRQKWGIQRITMPVTASAAISAENANKTVSGLGSYSGVSGNSGQDNDQGWNLIGDPYFTNLTDMSTSSLHACKLVEVLDANENWTGRWEWNDETSIRYLTIPDNHFDTYEAKTVTAAKPLVAGRTFFVQIAGEATGVTFEYGNRASLLPALYATVNEAVDIETGIVMSDETKKDEVNFWIKEGKTAEYEYNADYPKTPNTSNFNIYGVHSHGDLSWIAISPEIAEGSMAIGYQVPTAGEYMLSLSETYVSDKIDHVLVTDHEVSPEITTDLMEGSYEFMVNQAETNKTRFTVSIQLKEEAQTPTDIDNVRGDPDKPTKFIYHDKMYILRGGQIYDATGKQVKGGIQ